MDAINDLFVSYYFIDNLSLIVLSSISLFAVSKYNFYPGYAILVMSLYQVFVPCLMGTLLIYKGEQFYDNIYNSLWYLLPVSDQKLILVLLCGAKRLQTMSAGLTVISLEQFVNVCEYFI